MTVYVSQQPVPNRHNWTPNLEPATKYGPLKFVFQGEENPYMFPQRSLEFAINVLRDFDYTRDYLLWPNTGDPAAMWCVILALGQLDVPAINFLYWSKPQGNKQGYYAPISFTLKEMINGTQRNNCAS